MLDFIWELTKAVKDKVVDSIATTQQAAALVSTMAVSSVTYVIGWAAFLKDWEYRRLIETWYVYLKVDLDISGALKQTQIKLLSHLLDETFFSKEFVAHFATDPTNPLDTDPAQIAKIKRILLALNNLEHGIDELMDTNVSPTRSITGLHYDLVPTLVRLAGTLTTELNALNQSSTDVDLLIGSIVSPLVSKLNTLMTYVDFKGAHIPSLGQAMQLFPEATDNTNQGLGNLSELIYQLPVYFQELQSLIDPESLKKLTLHDSKIVKIKTDKLLRNLKILSTGEGLALLPSGLSTVKLLLEHLPTLLNASGHFTKQSHKKLETLINKLRHEHLPGIISELEGLEEQFSLRPNKLIEPTLNAMNRFYTGLASLSEYWETTSGMVSKTLNNLKNPHQKIFRGMFGNVKPVESRDKTSNPSEGLDILCDATFIDVVRQARISRWIEADFAQKDKSVVEAANRFFENATKCFDLCESTCIVDELFTDTVKEIPSTIMSALIQDYKIIQPYYAKLYPELDALFITNFPSWLEQFDKRESPISLIKQTKAQAAFTRKSIEINSEAHDKLYRPTIAAGRRDQFKQLLTTKKTKDKRKDYARKMNGVKNTLLYKPLQPFLSRPKNKPPLYRALAEKPSNKLREFINGDLRAWLEKSVDPDIFAKLSFDPEKMSQDVLVGDEIQTFNNIPSVFFYKKLLCSLDMIQKDLVKLEDLYKQNVSSTGLIKALVTDKELWVNVCYATQFIKEAVTSPELGEILNRGMACLDPLKNIPVAGDYIKSIQTPTEKPAVIDGDIVVRWKQQIELVKQTLARQPVVVSQPQPSVSVSPSVPLTDSRGSDALDQTAAEEDILLNITKLLYETPQLIRKFNPALKDAADLSDEELNLKASTLVTAIRISKCNLDALKRILLSINEFNTALSKVGVEAKSAVIAIENQLRLNILSSADEAEFQLGYKPGAITRPLSDTLGGYFRNLMIDFPVSMEDRLEMVSDTDPISIRIENEKKRLKSIPELCNKKLEKMNRDLRSGYQALREIQKTFTDPVNLYTPENMEKSLRAYQILQPYLYQIKTVYDPVLLLRELQGPLDFKKWFDDIHAMKGKVFLLVEQEKQGFDDMKRRCKDRIKFLERSKKIQEQNAIKVKQSFKVDMLLNMAIHNCNDELNIKTTSRIAKDYDPIIRVFYFIINIMALEKKRTHEEDKGNILETFDITKAKWNADCATRIRERTGKLHPGDDIEKIINTEVKQLYSDYFHLIDVYKQLDIMRAYIESHPSSVPEVDRDKIHWINTLKKCLSNHDISPKQRLINVAVIGSGLDCKTALEKKADHFFIRMIHKLYKLFFGIESPEKRSRVHLHKKFEEFKSQQNAEQAKPSDKGPPTSQ